jgi:hypothetical protein
MDEIVEKVMKQAHIAEEQARAATEAVLSYLQDHLPDSIATALSELVADPGASPLDDEAKKKAIAATAATTAAVNVVVLPHAR